MKSLSRYTAIVLAAFLGSATLAHAQDGWGGFGRTREYYESSGPSPLDWVRFGTRIGGAVIGGLEKQGHHGLGHHGGSRYVRPYYPHQSYPRRPVYVVPPQHVSPPTTTQTIRPPAPPNQAPTARTTVVRNAPPKRNATASFALTDYDNPNQDLLDNAFGKEGDTADPYTPDDDDDLFGGGDDDLFGDDPVVDEIKFPETDNKPSTDTTGPTTKP